MTKNIFLIAFFLVGLSECMGQGFGSQLPVHEDPEVPEVQEDVPPTEVDILGIAGPIETVRVPADAQIGHLIQYMQTPCGPRRHMVFTHETRQLSREVMIKRLAQRGKLTLTLVYENIEDIIQRLNTLGRRIAELAYDVTFAEIGDTGVVERKFNRSAAQHLNLMSFDKLSILLFEIPGRYRVEFSVGGSDMAHITQKFEDSIYKLAQILQGTDIEYPRTLQFSPEFLPRYDLPDYDPYNPANAHGPNKVKIYIDKARVLITSRIYTDSHHDRKNFEAANIFIQQHLYQVCLISMVEQISMVHEIINYILRIRHQIAERSVCGILSISRRALLRF